jgi:lathosterol oxidase
VIEQKINEFFGDAESTGFGTGWWSGILSAFFGFLSFGGVLCLHFPQLLTSPELRPHYPMHTMRVLIQFLIVGAIVFGVISSILRKKKILALTGMLFAIAATALGGSSVQINDTLRDGPAIGLDWFLLDLFLMALIYVPLERLWPQYPKQGTFRNQWTLDVVYFMSTHLPLQILSFLVLLPATQATKYLGVPVLQQSIARLPWILQFFLAVVVADLAEYFIHLALHKVPFLWRFHAVHHSSKALDWIAGSRSHFVDDTLVRGFILVPLMLGFSQSIILAYLIFVTLQLLGLTAISAPMQNGSKSIWLCPDIIIGTILLKRRASTGTLLFTFRGSIKFLERTTIQISGRTLMAWTAKNFRLILLGKRLSRSQKENEHPKNPAHLMEGL